MKNKTTIDTKNGRLERSNRSQRRAIVGLSVATGILTLTSAGLAIALANEQNKSMNVETQLNNVYQKNLYDVVEGVNNAEIKLSKAISSNEKDYQKKMLAEVVKNAQMTESAISSLPITQNSLADSVKFINQLGGYSTTVMENLASEPRLSEKEKENLNKLHASLVEMKEKLSEYMQKMQKGEVSITSENLKLQDDSNSFTVNLSMVKDVSVEYPTMIYDGPFSDSTNSYVVRGLKGENVDKSTAYNSVVKCFKNISSLEYSGEINSNFETINFDLKTTDDHNLFVQVSKIGGHILTVSGYHEGEIKNDVSKEEGEKIALDFAKANGILSAKVVWSEVVGNEAYFNIAPFEKGMILYPDLVKVKIDLASGTVIGYDATSYFINHVERNLSGEFISSSKAKENVPEGFETGEGRLVVAPLDYGREVICFEFESEKDGETYYFYINAASGKLENILKVISTTDGAKLM